MSFRHDDTSPFPHGRSPIVSTLRMLDRPVRLVPPLPPGTALARYVQALAFGRGSTLTAREFALRWKDTPQVERAFELHSKAAVNPGTTSDATWAGPLAQTGIAGDVIALLRGTSIVGALEPRLRLVPFGVKVPRETAPVVAGAWIGEGSPTPVVALAFDQVGPLPATKVGVITAFSRDLVTVGSPSAEATITTAVVGALGVKLDQQLLDPTVAATAANPAAITNGAVAVTSTGSTAAAIATDLGSLLAGITSPGAALVWIMRPTTAAKVAAALGSANQLPGSLYGLPVILSSNSPQQITLVDGAGILLAADPQGIEIDRSDEASVQLSDAPDSPATAATVMRSFFQENLVGVRVARYIYWLRVHAGAVAYMTVTY